MAGPLIKVKTKTAAISLDISRKLNLGKNKVLRFLVPDANQVTGLRVLLTRTRGFDRITSSEETLDTGRDVIIRVADDDGAVGSIIHEADLHVELEGEIYAVDDVPKVAPNVAQVYDITCKTRTTRVKHFR